MASVAFQLLVRLFREVSNSEIQEKILSLNIQQRKVFDMVCDCARKKVISFDADVNVAPQPLRLFITFTDYVGTADKPKVLVVAPTGVAAINVDGTTIHSGLGIPVNCRTQALPKLSDAKRSELRNLYIEIEVIIIDEISMVSSITVTHIHQQLCEIFGCNLNEPFAKKTVLVVGDLLQLPPVKAQYVLITPPGPFGNLFSFWPLFKMCELTEVMRQIRDAEFINLLNNVIIGKPTEADFQLLESCYANIESTDQNTTLLFAENSIKHDYNH